MFLQLLTSILSFKIAEKILPWVIRNFWKYWNSVYFPQCSAWKQDFQNPNNVQVTYRDIKSSSQLKSLSFIDSLSGFLYHGGCLGHWPTNARIFHETEYFSNHSAKAQVEKHSSQSMQCNEGTSIYYLIFLPIWKDR